jgi:hypothetical protein
MSFLPVPTALNGDGSTHAPSLALEKFRKVVPKVESVARSVGSKGRQVECGFRGPLLLEVMTIYLSQSFDALTFVRTVCAEMEEGNE